MPSLASSGLISYNLKHTGRSHTGQLRNWTDSQIRNIVAAINSPATQEKVRSRGMVGYYGHWPRKALGMQPQEGGVVNGAKVEIFPAIVTISIRADGDGNVTHETEFIDNDVGREALSLYKSRIGGFSSALREFETGAFAFYGNDYVADPNYLSNRGFDVFDSVGDYFDSVAAMQEERISAMSLLNSALAAENEQLKKNIGHISAENDLLILQLAATGGTNDVFDSAQNGIARFKTGNQIQEANRRFSNAIENGQVVTQPGSNDSKCTVAHNPLRVLGL